MSIGDGILGCVAYAGNVVLMAEKKKDMEDLLESTRKYGEEWSLRFSGRKCKAMESNSIGKSQ